MRNDHALALLAATATVFAAGQIDAAPRKVRPTVVQPHCATPAQKALVTRGQREFPGDPIAIAARELKVREMIVASGHSGDMSIGARIDGAQMAQLWRSIDGWGADTMVRVVLSPSSEHAFIVYGKVPVTQADPDPGYLDVYADGGKGIHSHIQLDKVAAVFATDLPTEDPKYRTRGINFYDRDGNNIIGIYASIKKYEPDPAAIAGFQHTRELIRAMPRVCR